MGNFVSYALYNEENFVNILDGSRSYYGGDQSWFLEQSLRDRGCGIVCAANIHHHMAHHFDGCENLYYYDNGKSDFLQHMYDVSSHLKVTPMGIYSSGILKNGFLSFARSRGVNLSPVVYNGNFNKERFRDFIISGLVRNLPVAYLQYYNFKEAKYNWHWMTITAYYENENGSFVVVSTWGERRVINFDDLFKGKILSSAVYFKN